MKGAPLHPKAYNLILEKNDNLPRKQNPEFLLSNLTSKKTGF
jgi:hypothetical protein